MTSTPTLTIHQLFSASQRVGWANQASQLTAYGLGTARSSATQGEIGTIGDASRASGGPRRPSHEQRSASRCQERSTKPSGYPPMRSVMASTPTASASRLSMLNTGNHAELINCGWLRMSDPSPADTTNAVALTSNRIGCRWLGSRHVSHAPTAYIGMMTRIHKTLSNDGPSADIASVRSPYTRKSPPTIVSAY